MIVNFEAQKIMVLGEEMLCVAKFGPRRDSGIVFAPDKKSENCFWMVVEKYQNLEVEKEYTHWEPVNLLSADALKALALLPPDPPDYPEVASYLEAQVDGFQT